MHYPSVKKAVMYNPAFSVKTVDVWEAYRSWAESNDMKAQKKQTLIQEFESLNCKVLLTRQSPVIQGIQIKQ
jgi:hypothetical protein